MSSSPKRISEQPVRTKQAGIIEDLTQTCAQSFNLSLSEDSSLKIITFIHEMVGEFQEMKLSGPSAWTSVSSPMGSLWGSCLVKEFGWEWTELIHHNEGDFIKAAVTNKDRSLIIYPLNYIQKCLDTNNESKILLVFNMLKTEGQIPTDLEAEVYLDLMSSATHVLPPEILGN